jgi:hypothetical protein
MVVRGRARTTHGQMPNVVFRVPYINARTVFYSVPSETTPQHSVVLGLICPSVVQGSVHLSRTPRSGTSIKYINCLPNAEECIYLSLKCTVGYRLPMEFVWHLLVRTVRVFSSLSNSKTVNGKTSIRDRPSTTAEK